MIARPLASRHLRRALITMSFAFPFLLIVGSWADGTWFMPGSAKGLGQHYGMWAMFITTPLILWLTFSLFDVFNGSIGHPQTYCVGLSGDLKRRIDRLISTHTRSLNLSSRSASILAFIVLALAFWWFVNVVATMRPAEVYGHDVFDGFGHWYGFILNRLYTMFVFCIVYSLAVFAVGHVTISMVSVLQFVHGNDVLRINFFHQDNCGGTSIFGAVNLRILCVYASWFTVAAAMYLTHRRTYMVMAASLLFCSLLAVGQGIGAVYYIHKTISRKKREYLTAITDQLAAHSMRDIAASDRFPSDLIDLRNHLVSVHTFPYATSARTLAEVIGLAPAVLAVLGFFLKK